MRCLIALCGLGLAASVQAAGPAALEVDAREVARKIVHVRETVPVSVGPLKLLYPEWIPGEHGPTGTIADVAGLQLTVDGKRIEWRRDAVDMFALHTQIPPGAATLTVEFDFLMRTDKGGFTAGASASPELAVLAWNQLVFQPAGVAADDFQIAPRLHLPEGWSQAGALRDTGAGPDGAIVYQPVSLTTLVDSPTLIARHLKRLDLGEQLGVPHWLHIGADSAEALAIRPEEEKGFRALVREVTGLMGARHYPRYDFLLALSDHVAHFGLEHHASSDNRRKERYLIDEDLRRSGHTLLPHEVFHSWNGKHRRPAGLMTGGFNAPMQDELLWVYEGLTTYYATVLVARSGLRSAEDTLASIALTAAQMDAQEGRRWRPLQDTAVVQPLPGKRGGMYRRGADYYPEGLLIWLEADVLIRDKTRGKKSLDDFCRLFFGGQNSDATVQAYAEEDVYAALAQVAQHDWRKFFRERLDAVTSRAPLGGVENGGWKLVYRNEPSAFQKSAEAASESWDLRWSLGLTLDKDAKIDDLRPGSPAAAAGLAVGAKLIAVDGRKYSKALLKAALDAKRPFELMAEYDDRYRTIALDYREGQRYPHLERDASHKDWLSVIATPRFGK